MTTLLEAQTETVQLCDEHGNFTKVGVRSEYCLQNTQEFCAATSVWVLNAQGEILCSQRGKWAYSKPGRWQTSFGGHIAQGISFEIGALVELQEEAGLVFPPEQLFYIGDETRYESKHFAKLFAVRWDGEVESLYSHDSEIAAYKWFSFPEYVTTRDLSPEGWCLGISEENYEKCLKVLGIYI
ncbi:MAG TPA: NUDIX domain-containing protein [Patescibacteria group bacterium]|nr:NUDIX domain-containing protein [Patescibacteria group bacterium]